MALWHFPGFTALDIKTDTHIIELTPSDQSHLSIYYNKLSPIDGAVVVMFTPD